MSGTEIVAQRRRTASEIRELVDSGTEVKLFFETPVGTGHVRIEKRGNGYHCELSNEEYTHETASELRAFLEERGLTRVESGDPEPDDAG